MTVFPGKMFWQNAAVHTWLTLSDFVLKKQTRKKNEMSIWKHKTKRYTSKTTQAYTCFNDTRGEKNATDVLPKSQFTRLIALCYLLVSGRRLT